MRSCLVCDDHTLMRTALSGAVAAAWPEADVFVAADFPQAWAAAERRPELILCDLSMPGAGPLAGIEALGRAAPQSPILVVTGNEDDALLLALFDLGIAGFVPKSSGSEIIEAAIRLVLAGGRYLPPRMIALANNYGRGRVETTAHAGAARLTARQLEVLGMMAEGVSNKEIARALRLSPATVKAHAAAILAALGTANRTEAAYKAHALGLLGS